MRFQTKAFALLSEEGIAKGIRRVTAVTTECAYDALNEASSLEKEVEDASKVEGNALEKVSSYSALKGRCGKGKSGLASGQGTLWIWLHHLHQ
ncbi:hypothetical protein F2Q70_00013689 [Brassica cretica]|uniref:Uncharacterized protein n=1 Tax=Brassica cretica TaxID=69181 RepID=A0A8S9MBB2_BRACR|nr:hypothetical protein F2Q70_00013689 [Brassica cretica]